MRELLCGPADFMSLKAREDYSTPEPRPRRPRPTLRFLLTRVDSSQKRRRGGKHIQHPVPNGAKTARCLSFIKKKELWATGAGVVWSVSSV